LAVVQPVAVTARLATDLLVAAAAVAVAVIQAHPLVALAWPVKATTVARARHRARVVAVVARARLVLTQPAT
jgi:hypothetical protein